MSLPGHVTSCLSNKQQESETWLLFNILISCFTSPTCRIIKSVTQTGTFLLLTPNLIVFQFETSGFIGVNQWLTGSGWSLCVRMVFVRIPAMLVTQRFNSTSWWTGLRFLSLILVVFGAVGAGPSKTGRCWGSFDTSVLNACVHHTRFGLDWNSSSSELIASSLAKCEMLLEANVNHRVESFV